MFDSKPKNTAMLHHLVYVSTASRVLDVTQLDALLEVSRRNNSAAGVTGLLVYGGGNFMQLLEGPQAQVEKIYARIVSDPCHFDQTVLLGVDTGERWCADWAMAYSRRDDRREIEGFRALVTNISGALQGVDADSLGRRLMERFIDGNC